MGDRKLNFPGFIEESPAVASATGGFVRTTDRGPCPGAVTGFPSSLPYSPWLQISPDPRRGGSGSTEPAAGSSSSNAGAMAFHAVMSRATT